MAAAAAACDVRKGAWGYSQAPFVLGEWFGSCGCWVCERCGVRCGRFAGIRCIAAEASRLCWDTLRCGRSQQALLGYVALRPFPANPPALRQKSANGRRDLLGSVALQPKPASFAGIRCIAPVPSKPSRTAAEVSKRAARLAGICCVAAEASKLCWDPLHCGRSQQTLSQQTLRSPATSFANPAKTNVLSQAMRSRCRTQSNEVHTANLSMRIAFRTV